MRVGEPLSIDALERIGYEPVEVTLVRNRLPVSPDLRVEYDTKSVKVVSVERTLSEWRVGLQNLGEQPVAGLVMVLYAAGTPQGVFKNTIEGASYPLIATGSTSHFVFSSIWKSVEADARPELRVLALALEDSTLEGDIARIAPLEASRRGSWDQYREMIALLEAMAGRTGWERIAEMVSALENSSVAGVSESFLLWRDRYSGLASTSLESEYRNGREQARSLFERNFKQDTNHNARKVAFDKWCAGFRQAYSLALH